MIESECEFCNNTFFAHASKQHTCSRKCGYALRSQNQTKWSKEKIIERIRSLHSQGISLNYNSLKKSQHSSIIPAAHKYFGGWKKAVEAAGFKPLRKYWNREEILNQVRSWHNNNQELNYNTIRKLDANFVSAVSRYFPSWDDMLTEAEIPSQRRYIEWDRDKILRIMRQQDAMSYGMHLSSARKRDPKSYIAAVRQFGSWKNALEIADIHFDRRQSKWNKKLVRRWLIKMNRKGVSLNSDYVQRHYGGFYKTAVRYLDSWDNALIYANIDPLEIKQSSFWRPELVIRKIQERHQQKKSLYSQDIDKQYPSLKVMAKQFFGSWRKAIETAGLTYKRKTPKLFGELILGFILSDFFPNEKFVKHCRTLDWLVGTKGHSLELDYYCDDLKLGIEFQGPTHFKPIFGKAELTQQRKRDERKRRLCKENGVSLIEVPYDDFTPKTLSSQFFTLNIDHAYSEKCLDLCSKYKLMYKIGD